MTSPLCVIAGILLVAVPLSAQIGTPPIFLGPPLSPGLIQYLGITDNQAAAIRQANNSYLQFTLQKSTRSAQVQREIAVETARPALDAMALGLRYLELEGIRREIAAEEKRTRGTIQALLTEVQKTKVKTLEDVMNLQSLICDAQNARILAVPGSSFAAFLLGGISPLPLPLAPGSELFPVDRISPSLGCGFAGGITPVFTPGAP